MIKKFISLSIGAVLFASPLLVSAQTTTDTSRASMIATLTALVQQLTQELQQLLAARSNPQQSSGQPAFCSTYADLQRGDTDATTNGRVSMLQAALGINPATGYYGALTGI